MRIVYYDNEKKISHLNKTSKYSSVLIVIKMGFVNFLLLFLLLTHEHATCSQVRITNNY